MSLYLQQRPNGIWRLRGSHYGIAIDESTRTRSRAEAKTILTQKEKAIFAHVHSLEPPPAQKSYTFAEAALGYLESGRAANHAYIEKILIAFGETKLDEITQGYIDKKAIEIFPHQAPSTRVRHFYTPVGKIMNYAAGERWVGYIKINRPAIEEVRPDWRTPDEIETLIEKAGDFANTIIFLTGTGLRSSEFRHLQWKDVSPDGLRVTIWKTKGKHVRHVDLCDRTRTSLPPRRDPDDVVWTNMHNQPWANKDSLLRKLKRLCVREKLPTTGIHTFRHTWASWQYALNTDVFRLMRKGGWQDQDMVQRYVHLGSPDLAAEVTKYNWFKYGQYTGNNSSIKNKTP